MLGAAVGWLAGIGSLAIPGAAPFVAAGPIMAALGGIGLRATVGGTAGALLGYGIPSSRRDASRARSSAAAFSSRCTSPDERNAAAPRDVREARGEDVAVADEARARLSSPRRAPRVEFTQRQVARDPRQFAGTLLAPFVDEEAGSSDRSSKREPINEEADMLHYAILFFIVALPCRAARHAGVAGIACRDRLRARRRRRDLPGGRSFHRPRARYHPSVDDSPAVDRFPEPTSSALGFPLRTSSCSPSVEETDARQKFRRPVAMVADRRFSASRRTGSRARVTCGSVNRHVIHGRAAADSG